MKIILPIIILLGSASILHSQDTGNGTQAQHEFCPSGVLNPSSPDVAAMSRYGQDYSMDLNQGILGLSIPIYTYSDEDFTIPVTLGYSTGGGYRPNVSCGPIGLGWSLPVGGVITREIRGIADEEGWTSTDMYSFKDKNVGNDRLYIDGSPVVYGWASVYDTSFVHSRIPSMAWCDISHGYYEDFVYTGKAGADYLPVWTWDNTPDGVTVLPRGPSFECSPDVFHFSFMGRSGYFLLCPGRETLVYGTEDSPRNYRIEAQMQADGFHSFTICTDDNYVYTFGPAGREWSVSYNINETTNGVTLCGTWRLTGIEAPDGRTVAFTYGEEEATYTYTPTYTYDMSDPHSPSSGDGEGGDRPLPYIQTVPTISRIQAHHITRIGISDRAEILFTYGPKRGEQGVSGRKLEAVAVRSLQSGETVRSASLEYHLTGLASGTDYPSSGNGVTLLRSVFIPGAGRYRMTYDSEESVFPAQDTYGVDWMGFYNGSSLTATSTSFCPSIEQILATQAWKTSIRQGNLSAARKGILTSIRYPTGGRSDFEYELNDYSQDLAYSREIGTSCPGYGIRISCVTNRDADGHTVEKRTYTYTTADGKSSGIQLWRPTLYSKYKARTNGYDTIEHETLSTADSFPYSRGHHTEYSRVVETREGGTGTVGAQKTVYTYLSYQDGRSRDTLEDWSASYSSPYANAWYYFIAEESSANVQSRAEAAMYLQSRMGGKPSFTGESSVNPSHRTESTEYTYTTCSPSPARLAVREMQYGHFVNYCYDFASPVLTGEDVSEYSPGEDSEIFTKRKRMSYDGSFRLQTVEEAASAGDTVVTAYTYFPYCPSQLETVRVYRKDHSGSIVLEEGVKRNYVQAEEHEDLYLPYRIDTADPGGNPWNPVWRTESTCGEWSDDGRPLELTDKAGVKTCVLWGYGGLYPVLKAVGISYDDLTTAIPSTYGGVFPGVLPSAIESAVRSIPDIQVTSWTYRPLVGMLSETDPSGRTRSYEYDGTGRLVRIRNAENNPLREFEYYILTDN